MLKKSASGVLASFRPSPYPPWEKSLSRQAWGGRVRTSRLGSRHCRLTVSPASTHVALIILRAVDLAAALLDGLFEHPAGKLIRGFRCPTRRVHRGAE